MKTHRPLLTVLLLASALTSAPGATQPNVLMIAIDDLNHWVGHLGRNPQTKTPNIDRLAKMGVTFTKAYCTAPSCNPSRASLMSGLRPSTTGCYDNNQDPAAGLTPDKFLNTHFLNAGYRTYAAGKIFHRIGPFGTWTEYFAKKSAPARRCRPRASSWRNRSHPIPCPSRRDSAHPNVPSASAPLRRG